mmetsp:Transcript_82830/g.230050  ORF Transcript_82830/g.230050 Transcript_82830/m.230050 type:complete len:223 (-) Transcript_82830:552-1220(-)
MRWASWWQRRHCRTEGSGNSWEAWDGAPRRRCCGHPWPWCRRWPCRHRRHTRPRAAPRRHWQWQQQLRAQRRWHEWLRWRHHRCGPAGRHVQPGGRQMRAGIQSAPLLNASQDPLEGSRGLYLEVVQPHHALCGVQEEEAVLRCAARRCHAVTSYGEAHRLRAVLRYDVAMPMPVHVLQAIPQLSATGHLQQFRVHLRRRHPEVATVVLGVPMAQQEDHGGP